jgi:hypothetical protein
LIMKATEKIIDEKMDSEKDKELIEKAIKWLVILAKAGIQQVSFND